MQRRRHGFTLIEMMVALSICLAIMVIVVPIFQVTTRTVETIERRLSVYEAARNILDCIEIELRQAMTNERGEAFSLKNVSFPDNDPFTPPGTDRFYQSRRESHSVHFLRWGAQPHDDVGGGYRFPRMWTGHSTTDLYHGAIMPDILGLTPTKRKYSLDDVSLIELPILFTGRDGGHKRWQELDGTWKSKCWNEAVNCMSPGSEINAPRGNTGGTGIMSVKILDFACAYWDEAAGKFKYPEDDTAIYFSPMPKAVRITITVADHKKRSRITLSRIVHLLCGIGDGKVENPAAPDAKYLTPSVYNRAKDLRQVNSYLYSGVNNSDDGF